MSVESEQASKAAMPHRRRSQRRFIEQEQIANEILPFHQRLARSSSFRRFARAQDICVRMAIDTADLLPITAPSLTFEDLRALIVTQTTEVFSPSTIQEKFGISPKTVEKQQNRTSMIDTRWKHVFRAIYETKIAHTLGMSTEPEKSWIHHLIETVNIGSTTTEQILAALPLRYFPLGTTDKERIKQIRRALQEARSGTFRS